MAWKESWAMKIRRRFRKPFNRIVHGRRYFITQYRGADFLLRSDGIGTLEVSAKIAERLELAHFMRRCADLRPDLFLDIGANIGLYSCILLSRCGEHHTAGDRCFSDRPDRPHSHSAEVFW